MTLVRTVRFVVGAALLAGGGMLVAPLATKLVAAVAAPDGRPAAMNQAVGGVVPGSVAVPDATPTSLPTPEPAVAGGFDANWAAWPGVAIDPSWAGGAGVAATDSAGGLQLDRCPPPPPTPLPPPPPDVARATPAFGGAYRSTLDVPPPPLLDSAGPPPAAPWVARRVEIPSPPPAAATELTVPATYRVRDGDDLGAIAGRFYGHPAAAGDIWAANRETIPDPDVLPIGATLRLPPAWGVRGRRQQVPGAIEPASYARPGAAPGAAPAPVAAAPWLAPGPAAQAVEAPRPTPAPTVSVVRVGPGETLASLAQRLYGDAALAEQIFAVNRDRLRSPDLVVAGMELRLPRPVTPPRQ